MARAFVQNKAREADIENRAIAAQRAPRMVASRPAPSPPSIQRAQRVPQALQEASRSSGGGGGGGGGSRPAPPPPKPVERYWWQPDWRDSAYNQQLAAVNRALADYETELGLRGQRYGTDYLEGVRDLGYRPGEAFEPAVDIRSLGIPETGGTAETGQAAVQRALGMAGPMARGAEPASITKRLAQSGGRWDYEGEFDPFTAAARGTRTARDEFAGRGMLRSSDFAKSYADFQDRLQDQLTSMEQGRARFFEDAAMDLAQRRSEAEERRQAARVNAMARAAAQGEFRTR